MPFEFARLQMLRQLWRAMAEECEAGVDTLERRRARADVASDELARRYPRAFARWQRAYVAELEERGLAREASRERDRAWQRERRLASS